MLPQDSQLLSLPEIAFVPVRAAWFRLAASWGNLGQN